MGHGGDDDDVSSKASSCTLSYTGEVDEDTVDDVQEIRNAAKSETINVQIWRVVVTLSLLATAIAITFSTYRFLNNEQIQNFEVAYEQFSRTVGSAVLDQQVAIRSNLRQACNFMSVQVEASNQTWPFVTIPHIVEVMLPAIEESRLEVLNVYHAVKREQIPDWLDYATENHESMVKEGHIDEHGNLDELIPTGYTDYIKFFNILSFLPGGESQPTFLNENVTEELYDVIYPAWEHVDAQLTYGFINYNPFGIGFVQGFLKELLMLKNEFLFFGVSPYGIPPGFSYSKEEHEARHTKTSSVNHPHSIFYTPIMEDANDLDSDVVAILGAGGAWDTVLYDLLPSNVKGLHAVLENTCDQAHTFVINGRVTEYLGGKDLHDSKYDKYMYYIDMALHTNPKFNETVNHCKYSMKLYPSQQFQDQYNTDTPEIFAIAVFATFMVIILVFFVYDMFVHRRNEKLINNAARTNAIVSSMFPTQIRERLILNGKTGNGKKGTHRITDLKSYLNGTSNESAMSNKPLADLFLETTILFADIAGFTAWSSVREPSQVFTLLETVFSAFDQIAKLRRVFKVETVGDCYVAAAGIPEQRADHAIIMVRFARDILARMHSLVKELEITLGPDTGDLSLRCGLHSGPVTAGVLRGERARFQLFGDTMNTAARVEHTGQVGRIHVSSDTAEALRATGKAGWLIKRDQIVEAKGKGAMQTYWIHSSLDARKRHSHTSHSERSEFADVALERAAGESTKKRDANGPTERTNRMVDWNVEILLHILRQILARRDAMSKIGHSTAADGQHHSDHRRIPTSTFRPLDEVKEIIHLPDFDKKVAARQQSPGLIKLAPHIIEQLRSLVATIASMYRENPFHNFEHASHVTMSVIKLLARIVAPTDIPFTDSKGDTDEPALAATLHDHTYGITSDPLTQFACAFSALIHDVDHAGVPNAQLVKEKVRIAEIYDNRSVAEQNSVALSWDLFMSDEYRELRECICPTKVELNRFRELMVNAVMATDIVDKELKVLRNGRWDKAFKGHDESADDAVNRKATIVIEHLIQASDVSHTMQHWHVYRKWNEKFFRECYKAYQDGRAEQNPVDGWYKGEIGFFDFYIIPLAKKLKECGVFGKSSDEYLNYAMTNRKEWERRGEEVVAEMVQSFHSKE